jgi:hypothetical protein
MNFSRTLAVVFRQTRRSERPLSSPRKWPGGVRAFPPQPLPQAPSLQRAAAFLRSSETATLHRNLRCAGVLLLAASALAAQPRLVTLKATIDPYAIPPGGSNSVVTIYKSTSLGTVWSPPKPTAIFPATRTNQSFAVVVPNKFRFYSTATVQPYGESDPSNTVTNDLTSLTAVVSVKPLSHEIRRFISTPARSGHR